MRREGQLVNNTDRSKKGENEGGGKGTGEKAQTPGHLAGRMKRMGELWRGGQGEWHGDGGGGKEDILGAGI